MRLLPVKKKGPSERRPSVDPKKKTVQDWMPFKDIAGGVIIRRNGGQVAVLRVAPVNLALKSEAEKGRIIQAVHEALNGQREAFQVFSLGRPVDLDAYLKLLEEKVRETAEPKRRRLLQDYLRYVAGLVAGGEALERRYYILLPQPPGKQAREEVLQRAHELAADLGRAGLQVQVCGDQEIIDLLFCFNHPAQAAFERPPAPGAGLPPQLTSGG
ncbi:MAG: hypothetical protein PWP65_956 [Clostridia bacterium]|nr:hypothetical protein [Clostridia bacterium]